MLKLYPEIIIKIKIFFSSSLRWLVWDNCRCASKAGRSSGSDRMKNGFARYATVSLRDKKGKDAVESRPKTDQQIDRQTDTDGQHGQMTKTSWI